MIAILITKKFLPDFQPPAAIAFGGGRRKGSFCSGERPCIKLNNLFIELKNHKGKIFDFSNANANKYHISNLKSVSLAGFKPVIRGRMIPLETFVWLSVIKIILVRILSQGDWSSLGFRHFNTLQWIDL